MTEIRFYHLERTGLDQVLPQLLTKALQNGHRIIVKTPSSKETEHLNNHLWTYNANSFLPHGSAKDGQAENQPIWITSEEENPNGADVLILTHGQEIPESHNFKLICDIFDGRDPEMLTAARNRWKTLKGSEANISYWQQSPQGGWKKA